MLDRMLYDLRHAWRSLARRPGFTLAAAATLALGIGATTSVYTIVEAVLIRPLPYLEPARLAVAWSSNPEKGVDGFGVSPADFVDWRERSRAFAGLAAFSTDNATWSGDGEARRLRVSSVTPELPALLGARPLAGRLLTTEDGVPGGAPVALISERLWRDAFGADPRAVGRRLELDGRPVTVVGVLPDRFAFPSSRIDLMRPLVLDSKALANRGERWLGIVGRLAPGATLETAAKDLSAIAAALAAEHPEKNKGWSAGLGSLHEERIEGARFPLLVLLAAVGLVLLVACANVATLLLAQAAARSGEVAVRTALGASRARLIVQLLLESLMVALLGGGGGLLAALWATDGLVAIAGDGLPQGIEIGVDGGVLLFTLVVSLATGLLFGVLPAFAATAARRQGGLRETLAATAPGMGIRTRGLRLLVAGEIALTLVLLVGAALLGRTLAGLLAVDPGFQPRGALAMSLNLPSGRYPGSAERASFLDELTSRLARLPGVTAVGATTVLPLSGMDWSLSFDRPDHPLPPSDQPSAEYRVVTPGYLPAMGMRLAAGRFFTPADRDGAQLVAVINQAMAARFWPGEDPLGRKLQIGDQTPEPREIVGVVADVKQFGLAGRTAPEMYVPAAQKPERHLTLVVRAAGDPLALAPAVRAQVQAVDPALPVYGVDRLTGVVAGSLQRRRFAAALLAVFAGLALLLAMVGLYGTVAYSVGRRTHEIGLRMALGARPAQVLRLVVGQAMATACVGTALGAGGALLFTRALRGMLYGVTPTDPATLVAAALTLAAAALAASYLPARRAAHVDPAQALRHE